MANQRFGVDLGAVGQRPMFMAEGGAAFPDLSGDGKITQKDILIGRGVNRERIWWSCRHGTRWRSI